MASYSISDGEPMGQDDSARYWWHCLSCDHQFEEGYPTPNCPRCDELAHFGKLPTQDGS